MFELLTYALLQFALLTGAPTDSIGTSGWGSGDIVAPTTPSAIGTSGWGSGDVVAPSTPSTIGTSGWGSGD